MAPHRSYVVSLFDVPSVEMRGREAHHLIHVLRAQIGEQVGLFNGQGATATAEITGFSKQSVTLNIVATFADAEVESENSIVLGTAVPKGDRFRWLVEKATELGVARLIPLLTNRSVVNPGTRKLEKMRQTVIEACKQSGRTRLMQIDASIAWPQFVSQEFQQRTVFVADPAGARLSTELVQHASRANIVLAIGPEGGFLEDEVALAVDAGAKLVNLGPRLLRIETAAIALAVQFGLNALCPKTS